MFTVNNKDIRTTPLTSLILNNVNIDILNAEQLSRLALVLKLLPLNRQFLAGANDIINKNSQIESFLPFNIAITNICIAIGLAEDRTRIGNI